MEATRHLHHIIVCIVCTQLKCLYWAILKVHKLELQIALTVWGQALVWHMHAYTQSSCYD